MGPRADHLYYDSFGWHTRDEYGEFARVYGFDVMQWPGYPVMWSVREFLMVTWLIQKAAENDQAAAEARKRISALRTGATAGTGPLLGHRGPPLLCDAIRHNRDTRPRSLNSLTAAVSPTCARCSRNSRR